MKKILICLCLAVFVFAWGAHMADNFFASKAAAESDSQVYVVSASHANVFAGANLSSQVLQQLKLGDEVLVEYQEGAPAQEFWQGLAFYKVSFGSTAGFMLAEILAQKTEQIEIVPNFNAKTNTDAIVFSQEDQNSATQITLPRGQKLFLYQGYNRKSAFTAVSFVHEGKVMYGYLKTEDISPNGINPIIITCAVLIVAVLGIIFAWLFMRNKKIKIKKNKNNIYNLKNNANNKK